MSNVMTLIDDVTLTNGVHLTNKFEVCDGRVWCYTNGHWVEITEILDSINARQQFINLLIPEL